MKMNRKLLNLFSVFTIVQFCSSYPYGEEIGECKSSSDCSFGQCCVLGMMRYSIPQCQSLGQIGHFCRMDNEPQNRTLYYPNGFVLEVADIYTNLCPCDIGLVCRDNICLTEDTYDENYLY